MSKKRFLASLMICLSLLGQAQTPYGRQTERFSQVDIPFQFVNGFIVVEVTFNYLFPLRFILDTGAEHTILTKREYADLMNIPFEREFRIIGSDMTQNLRAYLIRDVHLQTGQLVLPRQSMVVMEDDYFRFEEFIGMPVHGIIGANIFRHFVVKIDYQRERITLIRPVDFEPPDDYQKIAIEVYKNKPYLWADLDLPGQQDSLRVKLLLDTGASLTMLLHNGTKEEIKTPPGVIPGNIGKGLGGFLEGYVGRSKSTTIGPFTLSGMVTNYQELNPEMDTTYLHGRNGILGNLVLDRFTIIIDYFREELYLKPNRHFDDRFEYDRSGIVAFASGKQLKTITVSSVLKDSPAGEAGIEPGDEILSVNFWRAGFLGLSGVNRRFKKKAGKEVRLKIRRGEEKMVIRIELRELI
ncbi:MAG: PDZ domain-containing protein [Bacteroidetes bacterium]|nr:PDZ domain-containing protein [Bacteroidota bacterium]